MWKIKLRKIYRVAVLIGSIFFLCACEKSSAETGRICDFIEIQKFETDFITEPCIVLQSRDDVSSLVKTMKEKHYSEEMLKTDFKEEALPFLTICRGIDEASAIESVKLVKDGQGNLKGQIQIKLTALQETTRLAACYENAILRLPKEDVDAAASFEIIYVSEAWKE